jgi:hypothetical protein
MDIVNHFILICLIIITLIMMLLMQNNIFVIMSKSLVVFHIGHKCVSWRNLWVFEVFGGFLDWDLICLMDFFLVFHSQKVLEAFLNYYGLVPL